MKTILLSLLLASCVHVHNPMPVNNVDETQWKQEYADGKITWEEYQTRLKSEKQP